MRDKIISYMAHVTGCERSDCELCFDAMLDGLREQGWQAVPVEPTDDMIWEGGQKPHENSAWATLSGISVKYRWAAMLSAAPKLEKDG